MTVGAVAAGAFWTKTGLVVQFPAAQEFRTFAGMSKGQQTRDRVLEIAEQTVLEKGFGATSIEELVAEAGITKSGFFYHFKDKNALALGLLERYMERDRQLQEEMLSRAFELTDDPLQAVLVGLKMFSEYVADLPNGHPGCLVATLCYQERLFDREVRDLYREAVLGWRTRYHALLCEIAAKYPPREEVDLEQLADAFSAITEGGIVLARALGNPAILPQQVLVFRDYLRLLFSQRPS
ncbi:MAG: TetR/AcrR family transcriptional regulator [Minwuiales bacterium]|nr:TetR/AcrR family transcriptional regulator [Minwuiales bacterium]